MTAMDRAREKRERQIADRQERFDRMFPKSEPGRTPEQSELTRRKAENPPQSFNPRGAANRAALNRALLSRPGIRAMAGGPKRYIHPREMARRRRREQISKESRRRNRRA